VSSLTYLSELVAGKMDPFEVPDFLDPTSDVPDIDLDISFDGNDIMELDYDPDFNDFLSELAKEVRFSRKLVCSLVRR
jgi:hypothetical protein